MHSSDISAYSDYLPYSNNSLLDNTLTEDDCIEHQPIQVITGYRNHDWKAKRNLPGGWITKNNNITVHRDNRQVLASMLPTIFVTKHRSLFPKFNNFVEVMKTLNLTLGLHSEIWEDREKRDHMDKIEEAWEMQRIQYISNPRPDRRGGGAAISLLAGEFSLTKLDVIQPKNLEVVWGLVGPKKPTESFKGIIICSFYAVPYSKTKVQLIEHITINFTELKTRYKDCYILTGGDINYLNVRNILDISPTFHLHNTKPTHGRKNIDI